MQHLIMFITNQDNRENISLSWRSQIMYQQQQGACLDGSSYLCNENEREALTLRNRFWLLLVFLIFPAYSSFRTVLLRLKKCSETKELTYPCCLLKFLPWETFFLYGFSVYEYVYMHIQRTCARAHTYTHAHTCFYAFL